MNTARPAYLLRRAWSSVDKLTDSLTSYRLVYWVLLAILGWAVIASLLGFGHLPVRWYEIILSTAWLVLVCQTVNAALSKFLNIARNKESGLITALILGLIFTPAAKPGDYAILASVGVLAMASKYLLTFRRAHIFNPAAFGAFLMAVLFHKYASWWVGTSILTPFVFVGGWLILRKMKRFTLVTVFLTIYFALLLIHTWNGSPSHAWHEAWLSLAQTQLLFFAYIMLTEPMTSPAIRSRYLPYAALVAICYGSIYWHIGGWQPAFSPEQALIIGNIFAAIVAFSPRYPLKLLGKAEEAQEIKSFLYTKPAGFNHKPGQYMEWTLPASKSDNRGNRRYLTISSSPTEENLMITLRMPEKKSSYKAWLDGAGQDSPMLASRVAGSFTLPEDKSRKLVFLAGGVGITPFRSIAKYLADSGQQRDTTILYAVNTPAEIAFREIFLEAKKAGIVTHYIVSKPSARWNGHKGRIDEQIINQTIPDYHERYFYVSGPLPFVSAMEQVLTKLGVPNSRIKTDYFPGYA